VLEENSTEKTCGLPEGGACHSNLQGATSCTDTSNQDTMLPQVETAKTTRDRQTSPRESVVRDENTEINAFDEWSERAQGDYWGFQVRRKKNLLSKLRDTEGSLTKLSCQSAQMKEFEDTDASQLRDLEDKIRELREKMHQRATETKEVHQKESVASEAAIDLRKQIRDVDETLDRYWAEDD
jgi:chromosome segregation ATPase